MSGRDACLGKPGLMALPLQSCFGLGSAFEPGTVGSVFSRALGLQLLSVFKCLDLRSGTEELWL